MSDLWGRSVTEGGLFSIADPPQRNIMWLNFEPSGRDEDTLKALKEEIPNPENWEKDWGTPPVAALVKIIQAAQSLDEVWEYLPDIAQARISAQRALRLCHERGIRNVDAHWAQRALCLHTEGKWGVY